MESNSKAYLILESNFLAFSHRVGGKKGICVTLYIM